MGQHETFNGATSTPPAVRGAMGSARRWALPLGEHPTLELVNDTAQLTIVPTSAGEAPYLELLGAESDRLLVHVVPEDGFTRVRIDAGIGPFAWTSGFRAHAVLHVPASLRARIRSSAGWLHVERLVGCALTLESDLGAISLEEVDGSVRAVTQAGRIDGENLRGSFDVCSAAGAVKLEIAGLEPGIHRVRTNVGAIKIDIARGMRVRIAARTDVGAAHVGFPSSPDAPAVLELVADVGSIRVRESHRFVAG